ncbi:MAG: hypothetical protein IIY52_09255 [Solobacterium sp.]|nr:hypothetical protein [Solobacterium sp.]
MRRMIGRIHAVLAVSALFLSGCTAPEHTADAPAGSESPAVTEPAPFVYEFNPHVLSREYTVIYGPEIEPLFYGFCDAVLEGRDTFPCPSLEVYHQILTIAVVCLPVADYCIDKDSIRVENGTGFIPYTMDHNQQTELVQQFRSRVYEVITAAVPYQEEDFIIAAELLTAVANKDDIDEDGMLLENSLTIRPYRAIMENKGICQEIAGEYIYYLLQTGINAVTCSGLSRDKETAHMWALVELDGDYYHVDPMFTVQYPDSLAFFGLTDEMREQYGDFPPENWSCAESDVLSHKDYAADNERFLPLWRAESYTIDRTERLLHLSLFDVYAPAETDEFRY